MALDQDQIGMVVSLVFLFISEILPFFKGTDANGVLEALMMILKRLSGVQQLDNNKITTELQSVITSTKLLEKSNLLVEIKKVKNDRNLVINISDYSSEVLDELKALGYSLQQTPDNKLQISW